VFSNRAGKFRWSQPTVFTVGRANVAEARCSEGRQEISTPDLTLLIARRSWRSLSRDMASSDGLGRSRLGLRSRARVSGSAAVRPRRWSRTTVTWMESSRGNRHVLRFRRKLITRTG
jgi:hypothetical protein